MPTAIGVMSPAHWSKPSASSEVRNVETLKAQERRDRIAKGD